MKQSIAERASKAWTKLDEAEKKYGKNSIEYNKALRNWIKFLRKESTSTTNRIQKNSQDLLNAWEDLCAAKDSHGIDSPQFKKAEVQLSAIKHNVNKTTDDIEPIFRAVMSL